MTTTPQPRGARFLVDAVEPRDVVCPEDMGDDERLLMRSIREFAEQEVAPRLDEIDRRDVDVIRTLFRKAADLGIFMAEVPEAHGGLGLSPLAVAGMNECRSLLGGLASTVFAHQGIGTLPLVNFGTPAQIDRYLDRCMRGELMAAFALTEPEAGSDAMSIRTTAVLDAEKKHYVVNGSKQWITNAGWADLFILFAKVDGAAFSAFLLERDTPGVTVGPHERLLGLQGSSVCAMQLDDVAIPVENLLGAVGQGHRVALCTLNVGRMKMGANCAGSAKKVLAATTRYAAGRRQFGRPIAEFGLIQRKLADMAARAYGAESVAYRTAGLVYAAVDRLDRGADALDVKLRTFAEFSVECAMAKVIGSEAYHAAADDALQVYGGYGFSEEYPAARWYRDSRITRIYEGTSEICRLSIARTLLRRAGRGGLDLREAAGAPTPGRLPPPDAGLAALRAGVGGLKHVFRFVFGQIRGALDDARLLDPGNQPYLAGLADIAMETYLAESTVLRVSKQWEGRPGGEAEAEAAIARIVFFRSTERIRQEAAELLGSLLRGARLAAALERLAACLPVPVGLVESRAQVAQALVDRGGRVRPDAP